MAENYDEDDLVAQFAGVASVPPDEARFFLSANNWDLATALTEFYASQEEDHQDQADFPMADEEDSIAAPSEPLPGGGQRLGESSSTPQAVPNTSSASSPSRPPKRTAAQKKFATLGDFTGDSHAHDDDDDSDYDDKQDLFAGGEKSGLAVQNPDDIKKKILEKAMKSGKPLPKEESKPRASHFSGTARTLGGDDIPSQTIEPPPVSRASQRAPRVDRVLHFWNDGFSVDDGDLYPTSDPRNADILNGIRQGRAPLSIMGVLPGQEVDVEIKEHKEKYVKPKKKYAPFGGQGNRLGSPTPGSSTTRPIAPSPPTTSETQDTTNLDLDETKPIVNLQIRLGGGSRLPARFNTTHTIGDVYAFVTAANQESQIREWVLMTTFPRKELTDKSQVLGDLDDFKRGGVVVQTWR